MAGFGKLTWKDAYEPPKPGTRIGEVKPLFRKISYDEFKAMMRKLNEIRDAKDKGRYPWEQVFLPNQ